MACGLRPPVRTVSTPAPASPGPKRISRRGKLTLGIATLAGLVAILVTARATRIEPGVAAVAPVTATDDLDAERHDDDASWTLASEPVERLGYRRGRRHAIEVVPLGPTAVEVEVRTARAFLDMRAAAAEAGVELRLESGFRTVEQQRELYRAWRGGKGNKAARPGTSNHQSGRALDIAVISVPGARDWLEVNAASFGFKRTVKSEPWHWEYVDIPVARGASKRIVRKASKHAKAVKRPLRASKGKPTHRSSSHRVASSRR